MGRMLSKQGGSRSVYDIISVGDTTTDLFLKLEEATLNCELDAEICQLCINYADKVPIADIKEVYGVGNAANNAVGSARLGLNTALWTIVGDDRGGSEAKDMLRRERVKMRYVETDKKRASNYSVVMNFRGERTILVHHEDRSYVFPALAPAKWVYFTSMGKGWETVTESLLTYISNTGARLGFNPGTYQMRSGKKILKPIIAKTDAFIVNTEEARRILGVTDAIPSLLRKIHGMGAKVVVITDGVKGAHAFDGDTHWFLSVFPNPRPPVERTGAGDAFSTGFLAALALGKEVPEAMQWGAANSRMVVQFIGAQEGLQTRRQILGCIRKYPQIKPKKVR